MSLVNYLQLADRTDGFFIPSVTLVGPGCVKEVGPRAKMLGAKRALIVTDAGLHKMGLLVQAMIGTGGRWLATMRTVWPVQEGN